VPSVREQFFKSTGRLSREAFENVLETAIRIMIVQLGGLDEAHDVGDALASSLRSGKKPVRPAKGYRADSVPYGLRTDSMWGAQYP
jgi:hypothetical protein